MRWAIILLLSAAPAWAANFTDQYGSTVTDKGAGLWRRGGVTIGPMTQAKAALVFNAMAPDGWTPPVVAQTTIPVFDFFGRFTAAEFDALMGNSKAAGIISRMVAYGVAKPIDVTDPVITGYMQQAVTAGLLTAQRRTQILNLAVSSP